MKNITYFYNIYYFVFLSPGGAGPSNLINFWIYRSTSGCHRCGLNEKLVLCTVVRRNQFGDLPEKLKKVTSQS